MLHGGAATHGGLVKTDWSQAPFTATSCSSSSAATSSASTSGAWFSQENITSEERLKWVHNSYMI